MRVIFNSASGVTNAQAARNLHRFGIGRAIVWDDWCPRIARLEGFPPTKVVHSFYASPQVYERGRWAVKMVWGPVPLGQRPQLQAAVRERLVPLTQRQDVHLHADGRTGVGFVFSVYDEEGEDGYWVQAHVIGRGALLRVEL